MLILPAFVNGLAGRTGAGLILNYATVRRQTGYHSGAGCDGGQACN